MFLFLLSMKKILLGALGALVVVALGTGVFVRFGGLNFAADAPHSEIVSNLIAWAREQSIARAAAGIALPADLSDPERRRRGAGNYAAMCVECHLAPGIENTELRRGLYPVPPSLVEPARETRLVSGDARRFWLIKHGIKASGMPAWSKGGMEDQAIWDLVAFLQELPSLTPASYRARVATSDGHHHDAVAVSSPPVPIDVMSKPSPADAHKGHQHKH